MIGRELVLVVPDVAVALAQSTPAQMSGALASIAGRGVLDYVWDRRDLQAPSRAWQRGLLAVLGLDTAAFPSAATSVRALVGADSGYWLHAELVHLIAGMDSLSLVSVPATSVTDAEREALAATIGEHARQASFSFHRDDARRWLLRSERVLQLATTTPEAAAANDLSQAMPRGPDSGMVRRLMTELQMLLHQHPVNEQRVRRGLPAVNGIWLWGGGTQGTHAAQSLPVALGEDSFLRGIYAAMSQPVAPLRRGAADVLDSVRSAQQVIAVVRVDTPEVLQTHWIVPLTDAMRQRKFDRLRLVLDSWQLQLDGFARWRFWRRPLAPSHWVERRP